MVNNKIEVRIRIRIWPKKYLTHDTINEDEDQVEKDDEAKSPQEDDTIDRVDLHPALQATT